MTIENHTLVLEFPELRERIHALKVSDHHFARRFEEYNDLDRQIRRLEGEGSPKADETMEDLKKTRLSLKDELYRILTN
ncbi:MAG TPA: YdcH family protein [Candidatus Macondimonas sp.]|nr:YdcH family protein [Candidatus Macondimonas sp.]